MDEAAHQTRMERMAVRLIPATIVPARNSKWCDSRKKDVLLVVTQLMNSPISCAPGLRALQQSVVLAEGGEAVMAQPPAQPRRQHHLLAVAQADAGVLLDERAEPAEVGVVHVEEARLRRS